MAVPKSTKALVLRKSTTDKKPVYHDAVLVDKALPALEEGQILVHIRAVAFNHRDLWQRKGMYPGLNFGGTFGSDGCGTVVASSNPNDSILDKRVFLVPMRGWEKDPVGPETQGIGILGGGVWPDNGVFADYVVVERDQVILAPEHLSDEEAAAWPLGAVTAWRATIVNGEVQAGQNVLVTGIGGGVALIAMQLCIAKGANVYVSSSSEDKIKRAIGLGAKGGVNYNSKDWPSQLSKLLGEGNKLDTIIDSGGGDLMAQCQNVLRLGGRIVVYGMTASPKMVFTMREVMRNYKLLGSTMGSRQDLVEATEFLSQHRIVPVVSTVLKGLESADEGFEELNRGGQFGKIVIKLNDPARSKL